MQCGCRELGSDEERRLDDTKQSPTPWRLCFHLLFPAHLARPDTALTEILRAFSSSDNKIYFGSANPRSQLMQKNPWKIPTRTQNGIHLSPAQVAWLFDIRLHNFSPRFEAFGGRGVSSGDCRAFWEATPARKEKSAFSHVQSAERRLQVA